MPEPCRKARKKGARRLQDGRKTKRRHSVQREKALDLFALPFTFTVYTVAEDMITVAEGFLNKKENDCYMYKVQDVELLESLPQRIFGLGTVRCYTGDTTNPTLLVQM